MMAAKSTYRFCGETNRSGGDTGCLYDTPPVYSEPALLPSNAGAGPAISAGCAGDGETHHGADLEWFVALKADILPELAARREAIQLVEQSTIGLAFSTNSNPPNERPARALLNDHTTQYET